MTKQAFIVTGLGYGDEGKGTVTHWLSHRHRAHTVIRTGGPQALHHVVTGTGGSHVFSQFGSGSLRGSATHLSRAMLIDPHAILCEGEALVYESGIRGAFDMLTIHEEALVITPFQAIAGRVRELLRGKDRRGSVGIGVGETVRDTEILGDRAIFAKDLADASLRSKLEAIQAYKWQEFEAYADRAADIPEEARERVRSQLLQMESPETVQWAVERFTDLVKRVRIVDTEYVAEYIMGGPGAVVFEGSQGVLLDRYRGFHPYTTQVRTTPAAAQSMLRECGYDGAVHSLGVLRAYHTRHGGGPFVSEDPVMTAELPDELNKEHPWQGTFRVGHFDFVAARYALDACGGEIDGVVLTCVDRVANRGLWSMCTSYGMPEEAIGADAVFRMDGSSAIGIKAYDGESDTDAELARQEALGRLLAKCVARVTSADVSSYSSREIIDVCASSVSERLAIPVIAVSTGQTEKDKMEIKKGQ